MFRFALALIAVVAPMPSRSHVSATPPNYYLALGDSLAYGFQPSPVGDKTGGYPAMVYATLAARAPGLRLANMGCPAETAVTFITGGCPWQQRVRFTHDGPQLAAALRFITTHYVSLVTLDLGINDLSTLYNPATCVMANPQQIGRGLALFRANMTRIASALSTALHGHGRLVVTTNYLPDQNACPKLVPLQQASNALIAATAQAHGALVADVFAAFGGARVPNRHLCVYTWICRDQHDIHPTTAGYAQIARTITAVLHP